MSLSKCKIICEKDKTDQKYQCNPVSCPDELLSNTNKNTYSYESPVYKQEDEKESTSSPVVKKSKKYILLSIILGAIVLLTIKNIYDK